MRRTAATLASEIAGHLDDGRRGERLREGIDIAIVGPPNAGKSSLLNALAGRAAAIVSPHPGTTRDVIEVALDLGGYPVVLADTAGLREPAEAIEREGVTRAWERARSAAIRLVVLDGALWPKFDADVIAVVDSDSLLVVNKADLLAADAEPEHFCVDGRHALMVSARTGAGLNALIDTLKAMVATRFDVTAAPALTRVRHRLALERLPGRAPAGGREEPSLEFLAEDLRWPPTALSRITGRIDVEEVLDRIFRDFCIGK